MRLSTFIEGTNLKAINDEEEFCHINPPVQG